MSNDIDEHTQYYKSIANKRFAMKSILRNLSYFEIFHKRVMD